ncbi:MAG: LysM peptidoglycan-binding domain-containing protein [Planctomycetota bacterium]
MKASTILIIGVVVLVIGAGIFLFYEIFRDEGDELLPITETPFELTYVPSGPEATSSLTSTPLSEFTPVGDLLVSPPSSGLEIMPTSPITSSPFVMNQPEWSTIGGQTYTVTKGDSLWSIAQKHYHDGNKWPLIQKANKLPDTKVKPGLVLTIPAVETTAPSSTPKSEPQELIPVGTGKETLMDSPDSSDAGGISYTVRKGDTLEKIAKTVYGDSKKYKLIFDANRDKLKTRETTLKIGWKLLIPLDPKKGG